MVQDRANLQWQTNSKSYMIDRLERPVTHISRSCQYSTVMSVNMSKTARDRHTVGTTTDN